MRKLSLAIGPIVFVSFGVWAQSMEVPEPVRVPDGHKMKMKTVGVGELTYECRAKPNDATIYEWALLGPVARLTDAMSNAEVGKYYGGPTWESTDGSKITGKQVAVASGGSGNIPLQLVKAEPAMGMGAMNGITYVQRLNTKGGVPPVESCGASTAGVKRQVPYQADYVFYTM